MTLLICLSISHMDAYLARIEPIIVSARQADRRSTVDKLTCNKENLSWQKYVYDSLKRQKIR